MARINWHKVKALRGLLRHRKRVYPQRITLGKMKVTLTEDSIEIPREEYEKLKRDFGFTDEDLARWKEGDLE